MNDITVTVSFLITVVLAVISIVNFIFARKNDSAKNVENNVKINMKLDEICRTTSETRADIKSMKNEIKDIQEEQIKQKMQIEAIWKDIDRMKAKE